MICTSRCALARKECSLCHCKFNNVDTDNIGRRYKMFYISWGPSYAVLVCRIEFVDVHILLCIFPKDEGFELENNITDKNQNPECSLLWMLCSAVTPGCLTKPLQPAHWWIRHRFALDVLDSGRTLPLARSAER